MTVDQFITKYNGKGIEFDGAYGFQCMDLYQQFNKEVVGAFSVPNPAAADVWNNYPINHYTKIPNTPTAIPQKGDIVIWKKASSLPYGHIAVATGEGDLKRFKSFDQNWPTGTVCHIQEHTYTNVIGWLRPNKFIAKPEEKIVEIRQYVFTDQTKIPAILLDTKDDVEIQAIRGRLKDADILEREVINLKDKIRKLEELQLSLEHKLLQKGKELADLKQNIPTLANLPLSDLFTEIMKRFKLG